MSTFTLNLKMPPPAKNPIVADDPYPLLPAELKGRDRFCVYKLSWNEAKSKYEKPPFNARTHTKGNPIEQKDRSSYSVASAVLASHSEYKGIGFGMQYEDGLTCTDFDHCVTNGVIDPRVKKILDDANSYYEFSPSGNGIHLWTKGWQVPKTDGAQGRHVGNAEMYSGKHYMTLTGKPVPGSPSAIAHRDMSAVYERICAGEFKSASKMEVEAESSSSTPKEPARLQTNGTVFTTKRQLLFAGRIVSQTPFVVSDDLGNTVEYPSHSEADLALCTLLAFEGLDSGKIDETFRQSSLCREKWERADYRDNTIKAAIEAAKADRNKSQAPNSVDWRSQFRSVGQLSSGGIKMLVEGFLPEGVNMLGALPGNCKTLFALSLAKALTTGKPFLERFTVPRIVSVLYLIPESSGGPFRIRCEKFGIPDDPDRFLCRTVSQGGTLLMNDPVIKAAVAHLKPLVILDTAIRFNQSSDENSASANKLFVDDCIALMAAGARGILGLHHATKSSRKEGLTLESALRGTGDLAAMCDSVYGLKRNDPLYDNGNGPLELEVLCLKPRDFEPPMPFVIAATAKVEQAIISHIDTKGDFVVLEVTDLVQDLESRFIQAITKEPDLSIAEVADLLGIKRPRVQRLAKKLRYRKAETGWCRSILVSEGPTNEAPM